MKNLERSNYQLIIEFLLPGMRGQVLLITVLVLSGIMLGATTIAGLLMLYQIRQVGFSTYSAKAIFAADAGIEWELYRFFKDKNYSKPLMSNGSSFETFVSGITSVKSIGTSGSAKRAFERVFSLE